jgi:hypothetical protein
MSVRVSPDKCVSYVDSLAKYAAVDSRSRRFEHPYFSARAFLSNIDQLSKPRSPSIFTCSTSL